MIAYDAGKWGLGFIFSVKGSMFPKTILVAFPNAVLAFVLHWFLHPTTTLEEDNHQMTGVEVLWSGYTFVLGFLVVFRNNQAYSRFWEGATLINQVRGEWFNAISCLIAFCNKEHDEPGRVQRFQNLLVRLGSLMYCSALQQICELEDDTLEIIDLKGLDKDSLKFLQSANDRCEILMLWVQRLVVEAEADQILKIAPPILSRAYQELSRGIVNLNNVRKIKDIPFPFPYAQMITVMLLIHWLVTPMLAAFVIRSPWWAVIASFSVTGAFWCLIYIALEIDQPFGSDENDLPITEMQEDFNRSLLQLLEFHAQNTPDYTYISDRESTLVRSSFIIEGLRESLSRRSLVPGEDSPLRGSVTSNGENGPARGEISKSLAEFRALHAEEFKSEADDDGLFCQNERSDIVLECDADMAAISDQVAHHTFNTSPSKGSLDEILYPSNARRPPHSADGPPHTPRGSQGSTDVSSRDVCSLALDEHVLEPTGEHRSALPIYEHSRSAPPATSLGRTNNTGNRPLDRSKHTGIRAWFEATIPWASGNGFLKESLPTCEDSEQPGSVLQNCTL